MAAFSVNLRQVNNLNASHAIKPGFFFWRPVLNNGVAMKHHIKLFGVKLNADKQRKCGCWWLPRNVAGRNDRLRGSSNAVP